MSAAGRDGRDRSDGPGDRLTDLRWAIVALLALRALVLAALLLPLPAGAVEPDEILADPALEARAREISKEVRCLVCRNESIDDSNAELAKDLRLLVRERLVAGDSDEEVMQYLVDRFGEFVLLRPQLTAANALLWASGPVLLVGGLIAAFFLFRSRARAAQVPASSLTPEEEAELQQILRKD